MVQPDAIAAAVLDVFDKLPANRKPAVRSNGVREWVPLSGIVAELENGDLVCLALATGMKCLPVSKMSQCKGVGIHDWHAEVLALRAFNRFVLQECRDVLLNGDESPFLQVRQKAEDDGKDQGVTELENIWDSQPFEWRKGVALHMYCSEAPCGDASMELTMAAQDDASPWEPAATAAPEEGADITVTAPMLSGRGFFSRLGTVRRKPGRADAPPTLSKSCSDKLALRQCTTLLGGLASLLVAPSLELYLSSVVLPVTQYSETGCQRCFSAKEPLGRLSSLSGRTWPGGYEFLPFTVRTTSLEFSYSKRSPSMSSAPNTSSNLSVVWTLNGINECLVNGVLRGRKAFDPTGASAVSRRQLWKLAQQVTDELQSKSQPAVDSESLKALQEVFGHIDYDSVKGAPLLAARESVKEDAKSHALHGWVKNENDGSWGLDTI
ncbi:hypothetical protein SBRCBS47491_006324 [Sporothrix bragantina]|uniref:acylphosphatase n=1 Tax=Sporothrix bragantina TaxID=671064 RepID=A0ABP0C419_9PEZI